MTLSPPVQFSDADKLQMLRRLDQFREWRSLNDRRYCLVCGKIITGHQIEVADGTRGNGPLQLNCPTDQCNSIPMDWVLPTNEILAAAEKAASQERSVAPPNAGDDGLQHGLAAHLRRLTTHLKQAF